MSCSTQLHYSSTAKCQQLLNPKHQPCRRSRTWQAFANIPPASTAARCSSSDAAASAMLLVVPVRTIGLCRVQLCEKRQRLKGGRVMILLLLPPATTRSSSSSSDLRPGGSPAPVLAKAMVSKPTSQVMWQSAMHGYYARLRFFRPTPANFRGQNAPVFLDEIDTLNARVCTV